MARGYDVPALVAGAPLDAERRTVVRNPAHVDEIVGSVPQLTTAEVDNAVDAAAKAQPGWACLTAQERAAVVLEAAQRLADIDDLAELVTREQGKVGWEASFEVGFFEGSAAANAEFAVRLDEGDLLTDDGMGRLGRIWDPVGVVAAITPNNWPLALTSAKLVPALIAGNAVVVKPAPTTPLAVLTACHAIAGLFPPGLISVVTGDPEEVGGRLLEHPQIGMVSFTGGTATGRAVAARCASTLKNVALELGGNDAAVILDDAVIDERLCGDLIAGAFTTTGQVCFAVKRVYVPRRLHDDLVEGLADALDQLTQGDGLDPASSMGPLHTEAGRRRVETLVDDAEQRGAEVLRRGRVTGDPARGWFLQPAIVIGAPDDARLVAEEQFGPALPVLAYDHLDEAIERANGTEFGLASSVWTADEERGAGVARRLQAGTTFINAHGLFAVDFNGPFGGVKQSGVGRELGYEGLTGFTESHAISTRHL
jgi:acyl-CoA reductase-like NAD-dependent aldehyde dehydrogenase